MKPEFSAFMFGVFCLMSWATYGVYVIPDDNPGRRRRCIGAGLFGMAVTGSCLVFGLWKEFS